MDSGLELKRICLLPQTICTFISNCEKISKFSLSLQIKIVRILCENSFGSTLLSTWIRRWENSLRIADFIHLLTRLIEKAIPHS